MKMAGVLCKPGVIPGSSHEGIGFCCSFCKVLYNGKDAGYLLLESLDLVIYFFWIVSRGWGL